MPARPWERPIMSPTRVARTLADQQSLNRARHRRRRQAERRNIPILRPPIDLITGYGGGLDPHISREAARFQVSRVAEASNMSQDRLRQLVEGRTLGIPGESRVNVLALSP